MIRSIEIENLRGIQSGKLEDLSPLVVLVGPNGCGKSTVLDALLIGASPTPGEAIGQTVERRKGVNLGARWLFWRSQTQNSIKIKMAASNNLFRDITVELVPPYTDQFHTLLCKIAQGEDITDVPIPVIGQYNINFGNVNFGNNHTYGVAYNSSVQYIRFDEVSEILLLQPHQPEIQAPLHNLITKVIEQGREEEVKGILAEVVPGLKDIRILTEGVAPLVYLVFPDYAIPVAMAGDGVQSLLRQSLELASSPGGVVLLEEPEVHEHPGAIYQSAKAILAAVRRDVQVILTTHSLDLIDALLAVVRDEEELNKLSVYGLKLQEGCLKSNRIAGPDVAFSRNEIGDDLR